MQHILIFFILMYCNTLCYAQQHVTHASLVGVWTYFYITTDHFSDAKVIGTEQRLIFRDGSNVTLNIVAKEAESHQNTVYRLKYGLSLRDNVSYLSVYSIESNQVLGSYLRMPSIDSLEMASDPNFTQQKQLYRRVSPVINVGVVKETEKPVTGSQKGNK